MGRAGFEPAPDEGTVLQTAAANRICLQPVSAPHLSCNSCIPMVISNAVRSFATLIDEPGLEPGTASVKVRCAANCTTRHHRRLSLAPCLIACSLIGGTEIRTPMRWLKASTVGRYGHTPAFVANKKAPSFALGADCIPLICLVRLSRTVPTVKRRGRNRRRGIIVLTVIMNFGLD
jgi:hypothetical protein